MKSIDHSFSHCDKMNQMDAIDEILTRGVDHIYPTREALEKVLRSGKKLRLYQGFDPTGTQLHIGHAVAIRKLRQFQDLGHHVIFLIGDGTGQAGDPSGKMKARGLFMSREELRKNARDYVAQAGKIVRFGGDNPIELLHNSDWLNNLKLLDILTIAQHFSLQQMIERDMYQERMKAGDTINLREFMYPLLQGYDSVAMSVDLELGGTDQTFNMLAGRTLVKAMQRREKFVMTVPLLEDAKGVKIGKTEGNVIGITDPPNEFFAKIMALGDDAIFPCFTLVTGVPMEKIEEMKRKMKAGENPMTFKKQLAFELTKQFNGENEARSSQTEFEKIIQQKELPRLNVSIHESSQTRANIIDLVVETKLASSKSEAKRLLEQGAIEINGKAVNHQSLTVKLNNGDIIKVGKKRFIKISLRK